VTYAEAIYAVRCLPREASIRMQDAVDDAEVYWGRLRCPPRQMVAVKAAAVEVSLIASGALLHIACMR
jgi:hypothetical protein